MRLRTDNRFAAEILGLQAVGLPLSGELQYRLNHGIDLAGVPPAAPGDTWEVRWHVAGRIGEPGYVPGPIAGYAICCPKCRQVHDWTLALNCRPCPHSGNGSCWTWTGDATAGTLTASPSLHAIGACGWHGFLRNGRMLGA